LLTASDGFTRAEPTPKFAGKPGEGRGDHPPLTFGEGCTSWQGVSPGWVPAGCRWHGAGSLPGAAREEPQLLTVPFVPQVPQGERQGTRLQQHPVPWGGWHMIHLLLPQAVTPSGMQQHLPWSPGIPPVMGLGAWAAFPVYFESKYATAVVLWLAARTRCFLLSSL